MYQPSYPQFPLIPTLRRLPDAIADMAGSEDYPGIAGIVKFYQTDAGVIVYAEITGLPDSEGNGIYGFHIHAGTACSGNETDRFADALSHYNPATVPHPMHAGDLPPLFGNNGFALSLFLTNRFSVGEVAGKTIIIHDKPDDFTTQPAGNAGTKIACGMILERR